MDFKSIINNFFNNKEIVEKIKSLQIFFLRKDGILIYTNNSREDSHSVGALMGGIWQAALAMTQFMPIVENEGEIYRLTFDTTNSGVYMLPIQLNIGEFYLGAMYFSENNPAMIKHRIRSIQQELIKNINSIYKNNKEKIFTNKFKEQEFLFQNLSDDEINSMFSSMGQ